MLTNGLAITWANDDPFSDTYEKQDDLTTFFISKMETPTLLTHWSPEKIGFDLKTAIFNLVLPILIFRSSLGNALGWIPQNLTNEKSTLVQVIVWCHQGNKPLHELVWTQTSDDTWHHLAKMSWEGICLLKQFPNLPHSLQRMFGIKYKTITGIAPPYKIHTGPFLSKRCIDTLAPGRCGSNLKCIILKFIFCVDIRSIAGGIVVRWKLQHLTDYLSTLVQVMAWCHQAPSHYLSQCWPWSMTPYSVTRPQWVNMN